MKSVVISSVGSCDAGTRKGVAQALLEYNGRTKYVRRALEDTTANRCIIEGLLAGVELLTEPCEVRLVTSALIGVTKARRGKGVNADLVLRLVEALQERGCRFEFEVREGEGDALRRHIEQHATF